MITYLEAIREAQSEALEKDPRVYIYGQDIGNFGGAFKATKNLAHRFPGRVLDSPISEDAMMGSAIGAAMQGMRPIVEMQFADFSTVGFNQIGLPRCSGVRAFPARLRCGYPAAAPQGVAPFTPKAWRRSMHTTPV